MYIVPGIPNIRYGHNCISVIVCENISFQIADDIRYCSCIFCGRLFTISVSHSTKLHSLYRIIRHTIKIEDILDDRTEV